MPKLHCPHCGKDTDLRYHLIIPLGAPHACEHCGARWKIRLRPDELSAIESARPWTYITDDPTALPEAGEPVEAAWENEAAVCVVRESWIHMASGEWENQTDVTVADGWRVYAWRPLREVEAPPIKESE